MSPRVLEVLLCLDESLVVGQPGKTHLGLCCGKAHLTPPVLNAVGGRVFPRKLRGRARACTCRHVAALDTLPPGGVSVLSLLRGPDGIWGSGTPWEVRGPRLIWLSTSFFGTRGDTGPAPERKRVRDRCPVRWSRTLGVRLLSSLGRSYG